MGLREIRTRRNLTLEQVAHLAGCDPATISRWERGITTPHPDLVVKIAQALDVHPHRLTAAERVVN
jgi:transcriptional regulator with XRE-family HTH domain